MKTENMKIMEEPYENLKSKLIPPKNVRLSNLITNIFFGGKSELRC
jgi:hypothetical protein